MNIDLGWSWIRGVWVTFYVSSLRESCPTSRPSRTWAVWTQSGSLWWSEGSCSSWASQDASERCVKTRSCSSLYVAGWFLARLLCCHLRSSSLLSALLLQFSVFLGIIFFLELTTGVLAFVFKDWIKDQLNLFINNNIRAYRDDIDLQNLIDFTQEYVSGKQEAQMFPSLPKGIRHSHSPLDESDFFGLKNVFGFWNWPEIPVEAYLSCLRSTWLQWECCGAFGADDWNLNIYFNCTDGNPSREKCGVPFSCCTKDPAVRVQHSFLQLELHLKLQRQDAHVLMANVTLKLWTCLDVLPQCFSYLPLWSAHFLLCVTLRAALVLSAGGCDQHTVWIWCSC